MKLKAFRFRLHIRALLQLVLALLALAAAVKMVFQPDQRNDVRSGDALFAAGHYHAAMLRYTAAVRAAPNQQALVRQGMVESVRGEFTQASRTFARALALGARGQDYDLARLYQGYASSLDGRQTEAINFWRTIAPDSAFYPYRRVLEAEALLRAGEYAAAEATFNEATTTQLPPRWFELVRSRVVALQASSSPQAALRALGEPIQGHATEQVLVAPLLPAPAPEAARLAGALTAPEPERSQLLGQLYLDAGLYGLAEAQFERVDNASATYLSAQAYAAYARLRSGDRAGGLARLEALVHAHPNDARGRALLALAYLDRTDSQRAKAQLDTVRALAPRSPDTHLAWGQWYAARHDYIAAANEYRRALNDAPLDQRGTYLLALARFHLDTTVRICEDGRPAAEEAARLLDTGGAWTALAEARLACRDFTGALEAADAALKRAPTSAEASYYRGRALAELGRRDQARQALVAAADLAPASDWRVKAENQLEAFGL